MQSARKKIKRERQSLMFYQHLVQVLLHNKNLSRNIYVATKEMRLDDVSSFISDLFPLSNCGQDVAPF